MNLKSNLMQYRDAGYPIIFIESYEEDKADKIIGEIAASARVQVIEWNGAAGACDFKTKKSKGSHKLMLDEFLDTVSKDELNRKIILIKDMNDRLADSETVALLKQLAIRIASGSAEECMIIMISPTLFIPKDLEKYITVLEQDYIDDNDIQKIIGKFVEENGLPPVAPELVRKLSATFKGLTEMEINNILSLAFSTHGSITQRDLDFIFEQKKQMIMKSGILEMVQLKETVDDIGGLENLKEWLRRKSVVFNDIARAKSFGVGIPKGLLIAGVPGCGKSLTAKAAATLFNVPLLKLDMGRLMGKYVGESESNMRNALKLAEAISPCVLWIDELEKAFAGIGSQNGNEVTTRLFGSFLTWMQDKTAPAFVIATANDITKMPPELLRKGRFDEIFFVDLPNQTERKMIFEVHIKKRRKKDFPNIDISKLVSMTEGYSGADIEGVVRDGIENAFCDGKNEVTTEYISQAIKNTTSLSEIMKDDLKKMKDEYTKRRLKNAT